MKQCYTHTFSLFLSSIAIYGSTDNTLKNQLPDVDMIVVIIFNKFEIEKIREVSCLKEG